MKCASWFTPLAGGERTTPSRRMPVRKSSNSSDCAEARPPRAVRAMATNVAAVAAAVGAAAHPERRPCCMKRIDTSSSTIN